jgi:hypothetical protein
LLESWHAAGCTLRAKKSRDDAAGLMVSCPLRIKADFYRIPLKFTCKARLKTKRLDRRPRRT